MKRVYVVEYDYQLMSLNEKEHMMFYYTSKERQQWILTYFNCVNRPEITNLEAFSMIVELTCTEEDMETFRDSI